VTHPHVINNLEPTFMALNSVRCNKLQAQTFVVSGVSGRYCCYGNHTAGSKPILKLNSQLRIE